MVSPLLIVATVVTGGIAVIGIYRSVASKPAESEGSAAAPFPAAVQRSAPRPLTAAGVFWAVFGALWLFSITVGIVYAFVRSL